MLTRRTFTRSLAGLGALAATPWTSRPARSADGLPPNLVIFFVPCGAIVDEFFPTSGDPTDSAILQPVSDHRDDLLVLDGLNLDSAEEASGDPHQTGMAAMLTGRPGNDGSFCGGKKCASGTSGWASGISLDQWLARELIGETPLPSLELGVRVEGSNNRHRMSFAGSDLPVSPDNNPRNVFQRLFGGRHGESQEEILGIVERRTEQLRSLATDHQPLVDAHLDGLARLRDGFGRLPDAARTCEGPPEPPDLDFMATDNYPVVGELQMEMAVAALRCGLTRVVSLLWSGATTKLRPRWVAPGTDPDVPFSSVYDDGFHEFTHETYEDVGDPAQLDNRNKLLAMYRWYAAQYSKFLDRLAETPGPDGTRLLDNTMVLWCSEVSEPYVHSFKRVPFVLGGGQNFLNTGRYVDSGGRRHNALLVTLANAMGFDIASFGHEAYRADALAGILK